MDFRKQQNKVTPEIKEEMIRLRKEGRTYEYIAKTFKVNLVTAWKNTKEVSLEDREVGKPKNVIIQELILSGKTIEEVLELVDTDREYVVKVIRKKLNKNIEVNKSDRYLEIEKVNREIARQEVEKEKLRKEQLEHEKEELKKRFSFFNY